ncbi:UNVERIFIED_CONTAM: Lar family restriction alleviation protein [Methylobacteriaceae bacterium AG10]|nr:Lar family restriction alleviation protein [Methylobacteriaceae bacterium AG10]
MLETLAPDREDVLTAMDTTTLDRCPFCGEWAHTGGYQNSETKIFVYKVICTGCTATTVGNSRDRNEARSLAVKYWQRRVPTPALNREEADRHG